MDMNFGLNAQEQQELQKLAERKQVKEFMAMYTNLTERSVPTPQLITDIEEKMKRTAP
ncbi:hypothetical protein EV426DRAFT_709467 [Tirmania nivea]|nr:hypothetical protein EV426DRAFT_709467 [Tirmania nivea]